MKNYNEEHFSVIEKRTGRKIADCGSREDAIMMVHIDWKNRQYVKNKMIMGPVFDIEVVKQLPTNEVVVVGSDWKSSHSSGNGSASLPQIKLPEGQGKPVVI